ncbi:MAG TPA: hypothetical protein VFH08_08955 [Chitinophagaceae bacterium]|nr:hypothetical protein [Chitinophagaceae bacterium]
MKKNHISVTAFLINVMLLISSCQKGIDKPIALSEESTSANNPNAQKGKKKVFVSNLDELYAAVNDPGNAGAEINLAPGTYVLSASYPNGGRLELQTDMGLRGQPGQIDAVLIDQSSLPFASFRLTPTVSVAPIRMGRGTNSLEWLSVKGGSVAANPLSVIEPDLLGIETNVIISHVFVDCNGSRTGILIRNRLDEHVNRVINTTLEHTEIANAISNPNAPGAGLALQNRISGSQIKLSMKGNYIHGCRVGVLNFNAGLNNSIEHCTLDMISYNDRIEGNGSGFDLGGGSGAGITYGNNNTTTIKMYGATIQDNGQSQFPPNNGAFLTGISAAAGWNTASNNNLTISLWGCNISNNNRTDIHANGAFNTTGFVGGTNNLLEIYLYGISANAIVDAAACIPAEPSGTNVVNVYR